MNKYRVWDKIRNKMMYPGHYNAITHPDSYDVISSDFTKIEWDWQWEYDLYDKSLEIPEEAEIMQYIGEMDCNHKEICEGDILVWNHTTENYRVHGQWVVERTHCGWNPFIDSCQTDGTWHYVIIGNIYENRGLLATLEEGK